MYIHGALRSSTVDQLKAELDALAYVCKLRHPVPPRMLAVMR